MFRKTFTTPDTLPRDRPLAVYGAGENGLRLRLALRERGIDVACFLSTCEQGTLEGLEIRIFNADEVRAAGYHVAVASYMWKEIADTLEWNGITDYSVCDPNLSRAVLAEQVGRVVECEALFQGRRVLQGSRQEIPEHEKIVVLRDSRAAACLNLPNSVWEGPVQHHDPDALAHVFREHPAGIAVLVQHADLNTLFIRNCIRSMPKHITPFIVTDIPRPAKAFLIREKKAVFIPLPKCASSTILALLQSTYENAAAVHEYTTPDTDFTVIDPADPKYADWFKFAFVRHPLERIASLHNFHTDGADGHILHHLSKQLNVPRASFRQLVEFICRCPDCVADPHFRSLHRFVTNSRNESVLDFVGDVARFETDWGKIAERLDLDPLPEKRNVSNTAQTDYSAMYDDTLREMVRARYATDLRMFFPNGK